MAVATLWIAVASKGTAAREWLGIYHEFMANSQDDRWFGLRIGWAFWDHEPITTCWWPLQRVELLWEELTIVANASGATVIFLHSHPAWIAAHRRARERSEAIRRHPSFLARRRAAASGNNVAPVSRNFKVYSGTDAPA